MRKWGSYWAWFPISWLTHVVLTPGYFPNAVPQLPGTLTQSACSRHPPSPGTECSLIRKSVADSLASTPEKVPFPQTFLLLLQWNKMPFFFFKLERVTVSSLKHAGTWYATFIFKDTGFLISILTLIHSTKIYWAPTWWEAVSLTLGYNNE